MFWPNFPWLWVILNIHTAVQLLRLLLLNDSGNQLCFFIDRYVFTDFRHITMLFSNNFLGVCIIVLSLTGGKICAYQPLPQPQGSLTYFQDGGNHLWREIMCSKFYKTVKEQFGKGQTDEKFSFNLYNLEIYLINKEISHSNCHFLHSGSCTWIPYFHI